MNTIILPVILFTLTMTLTPGPNNMMLTASGVRFGYRRTLPLIAGIVLGIQSQLLLSAWGMGLLFQQFPALKTVLKVTGSMYLLYLAFTLAFPHSKKKGLAKSSETPFRLYQGFLFQFLNPKAYLMSITAMGVYPLANDLYIPSMVLVMASFLVITPLSISTWALFGSILRQKMTHPRWQKGIGYGLGALTAASVIFIVI